MKVINVLIYFMVFFPIALYAQYNDNYEGAFRWVELTDTFQIEVLYFAPSCQCGVNACAAIVVGVTHLNDTIRVLVLCHSAEDINFSDKLKIVPTDKPNYYVYLAYFLDEKFRRSENDIPTTYGTIIKTE